MQSQLDNLFIQFAGCFATVQDLQVFYNAITTNIMPGTRSRTTITTEEAAYIVRGKPIEAIKAIRARTGLGLREAKELCDSYRNVIDPAR